MNTATMPFARLATLSVALLLTALPVVAQVGSATFETLGVLSRTPRHYSDAEGMSADGSVVVGTSYNGEDHVGFRWEGGEMTELDRLPGYFGHNAYNVSDDGSVIVGSHSDVDGLHGARWVNGEPEVIEDPTAFCTGPAVWAIGTSADGTTIVGQCWRQHPNGIFFREAFRWTEEEGFVGLGDIPGGEEASHATDVTPDGSVILGIGSSSRGSAYRNEIIRWVNDEMEVLNGFPNSERKGPGDVSTDGSVVVGKFINWDGLQEAFRWTEETGPVGLGEIEGGFRTLTAAAVSADGSVIVGTSETGRDVNLITEAFIWTEEGGARSLMNLLETDYGVDLQGWHLYSASDISADGRIVCGKAVQEEGGARITEAYRVVFEQPVADEATPEAASNVLSAPSPNPVWGSATPTAWLTLRVAEAQRVNVQVFDGMGRRVQTLYDGALAADMSERLTLDASALPPGVYIVRATGEDFTKTRRVTVVR